MKTNGIIRRVDNLGRVVIPREYRKLHKISLGDPMEIFCRDNGEIVLRKIDMTLTLEELALPVLKLLSEQLGAVILVSNLERFVCGSGEGKNAFVGNVLPAEIRNTLLKRRRHFFEDIPDKPSTANFNGKKSMLVEPITGESDVFGGIFAVGDSFSTDSAGIVLKIAAAVLGGSLQKY